MPREKDTYAHRKVVHERNRALEKQQELFRKEHSGVPVALKFERVKP